MDNDELLRGANEIAVKHNLKAEFLGDVRTVGVRGDDRSYLPTVVLTGLFPGWDVLEQVSSEITNKLDIGKVTYDITPQ